MEYTTVNAAGLIWDVRPLDPDEQIEVECILIKMFGPAAGAAIGALAHGFAPALVEVLRETAGEGDAFDLAKLGTLDTADERIQGAWSSLLGAMGDTAAELISNGVSVFASRLSHVDVLRLFELVILTRKVVVHAPGRTETMYVTDYKVLGQLLRHDPRAKWTLLTEALQVTYGRKKAEGAASE